MNDTIIIQSVLILLSKFMLYFFIFIIIIIGDPDILDGITKIFMEIANCISRVNI